MLAENEKLEFKAGETENLYKEVVAFANTDGGTILVGVDDNGAVIGLQNIDDTYTRITNGIRDAILPDVTMFVRYELLENKTIKIEVAPGSSKPYYLKGKGLKPSGVFVRQGASSAGASPEQIRNMIKTSDGDEFEKMRALEQELTFFDTERTFIKYGVEFSREKFPTLQMQEIRTKQFTNLALILSDQCPYTVKAAVFSDAANTVFKDAKEFSGSVFRQLDDAFSYLMLCNRTASTFRGLERIDRIEFPELAVREGLINALIHRDYSYSGSIIINVNSEAMEFISLGGLPPGLSVDDIENGISQPRNPALTEAFHRLRLVESYGTGIRRIFAAYRDCEKKPKIEVTTHTFRLTLPNMNAATSHNFEYRIIQDNEAINAVHEPPCITPQMKTLLAYLGKHESLSFPQIQELLGIKRTRSYLLANKMEEMGFVKITGRGENRRMMLH